MPVLPPRPIDRSFIFASHTKVFFCHTHTRGGRKERRRSFGVSRNTIQRAVTSMFWAEAGWWTDRETCARRAQAVREAARPVDGATMKQNRREQAFRARGGGRGDTHHGTSVDGVRQDTRAGQTESWLKYIALHALARTKHMRNKGCGKINRQPPLQHTNAGELALPFPFLPHARRLNLEVAPIAGATSSPGSFEGRRKVCARSAVTKRTLLDFLHPKNPHT